MSYFSTYFLEIKLDIKWITILDENYYLLKAIQDQGHFLPPLFKTKIKENAAILTWKQKKKKKIVIKGYSLKSKNSFFWSSLKTCPPHISRSTPKTYSQPIDPLYFF
jgi:hypothetical protein